MRRLLRCFWKRLPLLPGLFEDMNNGWSYTREGKRITPGMFESPYERKP